VKATIMSMSVNHVLVFAYASMIIISLSLAALGDWRGLINFWFMVLIGAIFGIAARKQNDRSKENKVD